MNSFKVNCADLNQNTSGKWKAGPFSVHLFHKDGEPENANRLVVSNGEVKLELLPSKGLSVGEAFYNVIPLFWEPPTGLPDPDTLDLTSDKIRVNGQPREGLAYLETFMGGIEFYGLENWGMPRRVNGKIWPLHGETSNIPVRQVTISYDESELIVSGIFTYYSMDGTKVKKWYLSGSPVYEVKQQYKIFADSSRINLETSLKNLTDTEQIPDWGYHITFFPKKNARLMVPAGYAALRGGGKIPENYEYWQPAVNSSKRTETGIIFKGPLVQTSDNKDRFVESLVTYGTDYGIIVRTPDVPYLQSWICNGGANTREFTYHDGTPVFKKNWDGIGIEIGSSALDHDGNIDTTSSYNPILPPGGEKIINVDFMVVKNELLQDIRQNIENYNKKRILN